MNTPRLPASAGAALMVCAMLLVPATARAHCDGMDGPVVKAAQQALATGDVNLVLIWVQKADENQIRQAFTQTLAVRKLSTDARTLADMYFFETLVRIHRAGEGAPYTGLKPAGRDLGPAIPLADQAIATGNVEPLAKLLADELRTGLTKAHALASKAQNYRTSDVEAGRDFVRAYVEYIHYVERLYESATQPAAGHFEGGL